MKSAICFLFPLCLLSALLSGCTGWPPKGDASKIRYEPAPVYSTSFSEAALSRVRYVVVSERRRDVDTLREWMGCPSDEVREAVKGWYRDRHESDPDVEKVLELAEILEAPRRRAMARLENAGEDYKIPWLGIPTGEDGR